MRSETTVYRAQRWKAGFFAVAMIPTAVWLVTPDFLSDVRTGSFHGKAAILNLMPADLRVVVVVGVALLLFYAGVTFAKMLIDNRIVTIDAHGIEVVRGFSVSRAAWADAAGYVTYSFAAVQTVTLKFHKPEGTGKRSIGIATGLLGVKNEDFLAEVALRIEEARGPAGGGRQYDQRVAQQTAAAGQQRVAAGQPKVFGKRSGTVH